MAAAVLQPESAASSGRRPPPGRIPAGGRKRWVRAHLGHVPISLANLPKLPGCSSVPTPGTQALLCCGRAVQLLPWGRPRVYGVARHLWDRAQASRGMHESPPRGSRGPGHWPQQGSKTKLILTDSSWSLQSANQRQPGGWRASRNLMLSAHSVRSTGTRDTATNSSRGQALCQLVRL